MKFFVPGIKRYETEHYHQTSPRRFVPISLTGSRCELQCDHCRGSLLRYMHDAAREGLLPLARRLAQRGAQGILITGGSDMNGRLPLEGHAEDIGRLVRDLGVRVAVHTGLVEAGTALMLKDAGVHAAMIDIIGSADTLRRVCHLDVEIGLFEQSLVSLHNSGIRTVPHIVLGLDYGRICGEHEALRIVSRFKVNALVVVVLMPLVGTPMEDVEGPEPEEIKQLFQEARRLIANRPIYLGCARPAGERGEEIGRLALESGFAGIAFPPAQVVREAGMRGLRSTYVENCCAL